VGQAGRKGQKGHVLRKRKKIKAPLTSKRRILHGMSGVVIDGELIKLGNEE